MVYGLLLCWYPKEVLFDWVLDIYRTYNLLIIGFCFVDGQVYIYIENHSGRKDIFYY